MIAVIQINFAICPLIASLIVSLNTCSHIHGTLHTLAELSLDQERLTASSLSTVNSLLTLMAATLATLATEELRKFSGMSYC